MFSSSYIFRRSSIAALLLLTGLLGCGGSNSTTQNAGLFGSWNIATYTANTTSPTPIYVFALALSQAGPNYSGGSITYTGGVVAPPTMCINPATLQATATTNGSNFTLIVTDTTTHTVITIQGSLATQTGTLSGNFTSSSTFGTCPAESGTVVMSPQ